MFGSDARSSSVLENGYYMCYVLCIMCYIMYCIFLYFLNEYFIFLMLIHLTLYIYLETSNNIEK